jgi:hypothetical protein
MKEYSFNNIVTDQHCRDKFFIGYERLISILMEEGFTECALAHANNKKRIKDQIELVSPTYH